MAAFWAVSAGVKGDGRTSVFGTLVAASNGVDAFSWELNGSAGSLLGRGVIWVREDTRALALALVSRRQGEDMVVLSLSSSAAVVALRGGLDVEGRTVEGVFAKKPRMLCCLPVDGAADLRTVGRAGVRASAIVEDEKRGCCVRENDIEKERWVGRK